MFRKLLAVLLLLLLAMPTPVMAQVAEGGVRTPHDDPSRRASSSRTLDLGSTDRSQSAAGLPSFTSASILVGRNTRTVTSTDLLTAAEFLAVSQVLSSGEQQLRLGRFGNAVGGSVLLNNALHSEVEHLLVPRGVTAVHDFGLNPTLNLSGDLTNAGHFLAVSSNSAVSTATVSAGNIFNEHRGVISSIAPTLPLSGVTSVVSQLNLSLDALHDIINAGRIISSGSLTVVAGGSIVNALPAGVIGSVPTMQAFNQLNLQAANISNIGVMTAQTGSVNMVTQSVNNQGLIESLTSSINVSNLISPASGLQVLSSSTGVIRALQGQINLTASDVFKTTLKVSGGSMEAQELIFRAGDGHLDLSLQDIQGAVDVYAGTARIEVTDGSHGMFMRTLTITGDPDLVYTGVGPFTSNGFASDGGIVKIDTTVDSVTGSIVFLGDINTTPGATGSGGSVFLNAGTTIATANIISSGNNSGNGGDVTLTSRLGITTGHITSSGGATAGTPGNIAISAGTAGAGSVYLGNVTATGQPNLESFKGVSISTPDALTAGQITVAGPVTLAAVNNIQVAGVDASTSSRGGDVAIRSTSGGLTVALAGIRTSGAGSGYNSGAVDLLATNGAIAITGGVNTSGSAGATAGSVSAVGGSFNLSGNLITSSLGASGDAGDVSIFSEGNLTTSSISANGGTTQGSGGQIYLSAGNSGVGNLTVTTVSSRGAGSGGNGGSLMAVTPGVMSLGNVNLSTTGTGRGGTLTLQTGTTGTSRAAAQSGLLGVGRRDARTSESGGMHVTVSDISIVSVIKNSESLRALRESTSIADRNLLSNLERLAAALHMITQSRGAFTAVPKRVAPAKQPVLLMVKNPPSQ